MGRSHTGPVAALVVLTLIVVAIFAMFIHVRRNLSTTVLPLLQQQQAATTTVPGQPAKASAGASLAQLLPLLLI